MSIVDKQLHIAHIHSWSIFNWMLDFEYCKQRDPEHCEKSDFHVIPMFENILVCRFSIFHVHVHGGLSWAKLEVKAGHPELYLGLGQEQVENKWNRSCRNPQRKELLG